MKHCAMLIAGISGVLLMANMSLDAFDRVVDALAMGGKAKGPRRVEQRAVAAASLRSAGARPIESSADVARDWSTEKGTAEIPYRNRLLGPGYRTFVLPGGDTARMEQTFLAGQHARVAAIAFNRVAFDLTVSEQAEPVACHVGTDRTSCDWVPIYTARYLLTLRNRSAAQAGFAIVLE